jgi:hypothetical protein
MDSRVKDVVGLAINDKPRKAAQIFNDIILDKVAQKVELAKNQVANSMVGQEFEPQLDEPEIQVDDEQEDQHDQEYIEEPSDDVEGAEDDWDVDTTDADHNNN